MTTKTWSAFLSARSHLSDCRYLATVALLVASLSSKLFAQEQREASDARLRADCQLAAQTLNKGHPGPKSDWALSVIYWCDESGGPVLGELWGAAPTDSVALEHLVNASTALLDQRVFVGLLSAARNTAAPRAVRLAALRVLCAYVSPSTVISPDDLAKPRADTAVIPLFGTVDHAPYQRIGAIPLSLSARNDIRDLLATLWRSDPDPVLRSAGRSLSKRFF